MLVTPFQLSFSKIRSGFSKWIFFVLRWRYYAVHPPRSRFRRRATVVRRLMVFKISIFCTTLAYAVYPPRSRLRRRRIQISSYSTDNVSRNLQFIENVWIWIFLHVGNIDYGYGANKNYIRIEIRLSYKCHRPHFTEVRERYHIKTDSAWLMI